MITSSGDDALMATSATASADRTPTAGPRSEAALKARYCVQMMGAGTVLAATAPDDFRRRVVARSVFVYCREFIRWARRAKNELKAHGAKFRDTIRDLDRDLNEFETRDWGPYEEVRHRIAAHRQPLGSMLENSGRWTDISDATIRILSEDARSIWNLLAAAHEILEISAFPPVSTELEEALTERGFEPSPAGLAAGVGSFDGTREDAVAVTQGGDLGELNRHIVDALRNGHVLGALWEAANGHPPYARFVLAAVVTEACTLVDLVYEQPADTPDAYRQRSLLELLEVELPASPAIPVLRSRRDSLNAQALVHVRALRNAFGAHVDDVLRINDILDMQERFSANALNTVLDNVGTALADAVRAEMALRPIAMFDQHIEGFELNAPPDDAKPY